MSAELIGFIILSAGVLASGAVVIIARNPIHSAIALIMSFFFLAGLYLTLNANFVAIIQVLVYAGAIMVLFMFVIMLLNLSDDELGESRWNFHKVLGAGAALVACGALIWAIVGAQQSYLEEPGYMRNHSMQRLDRMAQQHPFVNQGVRDAFFQRAGKLRTLSRQKLRIERGTDEVRADACSLIAQFTVDIDAASCAQGETQKAARGYAVAEIADIDRQLLELAAQIDPSPVPAAWRGDRAERRPAIEPTRRERAVLAVIDITFAIRLERMTDDFAAQILDRGEIAAFNALGSVDTGGQGTGANPADERGAAVLKPGGRIKGAMARVETLRDLARDKDHPQLGLFETRSEQLIGEYTAIVTDALIALRTGHTGEVLQALVAIQSISAGEMSDIERQQVREVLSDLGRGGPRYLGILLRPVVYDEDEFGSVEAVGTELLTKWLLPFEVTAVLLLVGIIGATVIAKRRI